VLWLHTGHVVLNKHLHCVKKAESPDCPYCNNNPETVEHFLLVCPQYVQECHILRNALRRNANSTLFLLTQPMAVGPLIGYVNST
ncbi:hypothetical protein HYDPIDRAFT_60899, partial [Hydnomerulius pinastri MD-312]